MAADKPPIGFKSAFKKAQKIAADSRQATELIGAARAKAEKKKDQISQMKEDLENLFRMVTSWAKGDYRKVPMRTIVLAISGVIYFLNPFDLAHDYIPGLGYLDDATLISFVINSIQKDLKEFLIWEKHTPTKTAK